MTITSKSKSIISSVLIVLSFTLVGVFKIFINKDITPVALFIIFVCIGIGLLLLFLNIFSETKKKSLGIDPESLSPKHKHIFGATDVLDEDEKESAKEYEIRSILDVVNAVTKENKKEFLADFDEYLNFILASKDLYSSEDSSRRDRGEQRLKDNAEGFVWVDNGIRETNLKDDIDD